MSQDNEGDATERIQELLERGQSGEEIDQDELFCLVYPEFRRIAEYLMRNERRDHTLQPTALVHEAYMRMGNGLETANRATLVPLVAKAMRHVLVDHARRRRTHKRGGRAGRIALEYVEQFLTAQTKFDLEDLEQALERLNTESENCAVVVDLCFFLGMTSAAAAEVLGVSERTVENRLRVAKVALRRHLKGYEDEGLTCEAEGSALRRDRA